MFATHDKADFGIMDSGAKAGNIGAALRRLTRVARSLNAAECGVRLF
jgi:hypothetical protein